MMGKLLHYLKILFTILYEKFQVNFLNLIKIRINHPKLLVGKSIQVIFNKNYKFITSSSNQIFDYARIIFPENGKLILSKGSWIGHNVLVNAKNVKLGKYSGIHSFGIVTGDVSIGDYVMIAKNSFISSGKHLYEEMPYLPIKMEDTLYVKNNGEYSNSINIHDDVWIGVNCVVMPGVTIGKGAVIGSNSVITKDVEPYHVMAGNPVKLIKKRYHFKPPTFIEASNKYDFPYFYSGFDIEKDVFIPISNHNTLKANQNFSIALNTDNKTKISLEICSLEKPHYLVYENQKKLIECEMSLISFDIKSKEIFIFKTNEIISLQDRHTYKVKKVFVE
jgi:acetyltransferase-like isoleucine patch superfamily enzyme